MTPALGLPIGERGEEMGMAPTDGLGFAGRLEPLARVVTDRLEHREARFVAARLVLVKEALVQQRREVIERCVTDLLRGGDVPAADENAQTRENLLLVRVEREVAPLDRRA